MVRPTLVGLDHQTSTAISRTGPAEGILMKQRAHVLIAGAGIGGLTAALALLRRRSTSTYSSKLSNCGRSGAGVQLSANGSRALYALGIGKTLADLSCEATAKEIRLWTTGQTWKLFDLGAESVARYGFPYFTVYRPDLLATLVEGVRRESRTRSISIPKFMVLRKRERI
jgi:salicylate hydroxylase